MDNQQYQSFSQKDEFSSRLDKALNEYASLQNAFASYKGNSSSRPQTPQMNLMSPNDSRLISNNPKIMNTPSTVNIIKEFRNVFQEAENTNTKRSHTMHRCRIFIIAHNIATDLTSVRIPHTILVATDFRTILSLHLEDVRLVHCTNIHDVKPI